MKTLQPESRSVRSPEHIAGQLEWAAVDTGLGSLGLVWSRFGLRRLLLPGDDLPGRVKTLEPAARRGAPPAWISDLAERLIGHLRGDVQRFDDVPLHIEGLTPFQTAVLGACRTIPAGAVVTYGELAARAGKGGAARAVGGALSRNPVPIIIPCHRVVGRGRPGGFTAPGGLDTKQAILAAEGVTLTR